MRRREKERREKGDGKDVKKQMVGRKEARVMLRGEGRRRRRCSGREKRGRGE